MEVAIDPGITASGVVLFAGGKAILTKTFRPKKRDDPIRVRRQEIVDAILVWITEISRIRMNKITVIAVEEPGMWGRQGRGSNPTLRIFHHFNGYLLGRLDAYCLDSDIKLREISKGTKKKEEAYMVAASKGFEGDAHQIDAFYIGALGGFVA